MTAAERAMLEALMSDLDLPALVGLQRPGWMADGACLEHPEVEFVPLNPVTEANAYEARAICAGCACREECRAYALADPVLRGIWGGTTTAERREMRRQAAA